MQSAEKDAIVARLRELASDLDLYSFTINDGIVARKATEIESLADRLSACVLPPGSGDKS